MFVLYYFLFGKQIMSQELPLNITEQLKALSREASVSGNDGSIAYIYKVKPGFLQNGPAGYRSVCSQSFLFTQTWQNNEGPS